MQGYPWENCPSSLCGVTVHARVAMGKSDLWCAALDGPRGGPNTSAQDATTKSRSAIGGPQ
eukprot:8283649-Pyramimonas_sp.AAC.1